MTDSIEMEDLKVRLQSHLSEIVRERDPYFSTQGHFYVQTYIHQTLSQSGVVERHEFKVSARSHQNLILDLPGRKPNLTPDTLDLDFMAGICSGLCNGIYNMH